VSRMILCALLLLVVSTLPVSAQVVGASCTAWSTSGVAFGTYIPTSSSPTDATGQVQVSCVPVLGCTCQLGCSYTIAASTGFGTYTQRKLISGGASLRYQLYTDPAYSVVWGNGTSGSAVINGSFPFFCIQDTHTSTFYARIPPQQAPQPGIYGDIIVVTVTY
jgi:spore coat protein U-like protein